jgi:hypothetical protein
MADNTRGDRHGQLAMREAERSFLDGVTPGEQSNEIPAQIVKSHRIIANTAEDAIGRLVAVLQRMR